jgi:lysophospholipase L1-like esterase
MAYYEIKAFSLYSIGKALRYFVLLAIALTPVTATANSLVGAEDPYILYTGRWDRSNFSAPWAQAKASSIIVVFEGSSVSVDLEGSTSEYLRAIVDDDAANSVKFQLRAGVNSIATGLADGEHKLELIKETDVGRMTLNGIHLDAGKGLSPPPARPPRKIEFYGDSNQAGYSLESERNEGARSLQGAYYTYPGIVARMFDAEHVNFSKSGATISSLDTAHGRTDWNSNSPGWDFGQFPANLVVVNIGANDSGPKRRLKTRYHNLLDDLRAEQPSAHIMLFNAYGWSFNEPAEFIHEVIAERNDSKMSFAVFPWVFAQFHGCEYDHGGMAMVLAGHIESVLGWSSAQQDVLSGFGVGGDVANGSFEAVAPFGGWGWRYFDDAGVSRIHDPAGAHDDDHYLRLSNGAHFQQTNPADGGKTYTVSAWMRGANGGEEVEIKLDFRDQGMGAGEVNPIVAYPDSRILTSNWDLHSWSATAPSDGNPVYATRVTFTAGAGNTVDIDAVQLTTDEPPPPPPPPPPPGCDVESLHVRDIQPGTVSASKGRKFGRASVTIWDNCDNPVQGAQVSGQFSGDYNESADKVTGQDGNAVLVTSGQQRKPSFTFCVTDVTGDHDYDESANVETCDSL